MNRAKIRIYGVDVVRGFERKNQLLSLCGLNCGLCPMLLGGHCDGCGINNQSCAIAKCSLKQEKIEYCFECTNYPCEKYQHIDDYDSFITHRRQKLDLNKAQTIGIDKYNLEQREKIKILDYLLSNYNNGRRKNFFCVAVNLLELSEIQEVINLLKIDDKLNSLSIEEQGSYIVDELKKIADKRDIKLELIKKK